jgi:hypothetical protein
MSLNISKRLNELNETGIVTYDSVVALFEDIDYSITVKKITNDGYLLLIHNNFTKDDTSDIYNECRSFALTIENNKAVIVSYSHENIIPVNNDVFIAEKSDNFIQAHEGTMVSMFHHIDTWHYITSRCTDINASYFYNSDLTFGHMFDECLTNINQSRATFEQLLNTDHCYNFVIVHHKNKYVIDYTDDYGENYGKLVLVIEREMEHFTEIASDAIDGIIIPQSYTNMDTMITNSTHTESIICKRLDVDRNTFKYYKIQSQDYLLKCKRKPKFSNIWYSYIQVFLDNKPDLTIDMFREENKIDKVYVVANQDVNITGMIHLLYKHSAIVLMNMVLHFTQFDYENQSFTKINSDDYKVLNDSQHNVLKKQIATIQSLMRIGSLKNTNSIIMHLRKYINVSQFINIIKSFHTLKNTSFCNFNNKYYENYITFLINEIN